MIPRPRTIPALLVVAGLLLPGAALRADKAVDELKEYREPVDQAIEKALAFLSRHQEKDGSFKSRGMRHNTGIASLCVMAFLSKGHTPGHGPYGKTINRGIDYVIKAQKKNGLLVGRQSSHGPMYSHTIATLMLSEVSGMVDPERQKRIDKALPRAMKVILSAQKIKKDERHEGGWRYQHNSRDSDISLTGWALMSLRSARGNGAEVPRGSIKQAVRYVLRCRHSSGGFCYMPGQSPGFARTGTALLCLELTGKHRDKATLGAGDWILKHLPKRFGGRSGFFYYGMYYCSQGMFQLGGDYWTTWAKRMYEMMVKYQNKDGSWPRGGGNEGSAGVCYSTAMGVLAMSVSYRQLPIYQR